MPAAAKLMADNNLAAGSVAGTGKDGRVTKGDALAALRGDEALVNGLGASVVEHFCRIKQSEINRHADAQDKADFERREYFSRY